MIDRRGFVAGLGFGGLALPGAVSAEDPKKPTEAKVVTSSEAKSVWAMGVYVTIHADSKVTGGGYSVFEDLIPPGGGPPLHTHTKEDETMFVIDGELEVVLGDKTYQAKAGDFAHMARGTPHKFKNVGKTPARLLMSYSPGGFEAWFVEVGTPATDPKAEPPKPSEKDLQAAVKAAQRYGVTFAKK